MLGLGLPPGMAAEIPETRPDMTAPQGARSDLISISVQNIDINDFFKGISKTKKINIVTSRDVSGNISVNLYNVPLEETLQAVCLANGYEWTQQKDIFYVFRREDKPKKIQAFNTVVKSFRINFADIDEVRTVMEDILGKESFTIHKNAKTLIVEDSAENVAKIEHILEQIDYPPQQVLIEAKILEVTLGENLSLGVDWEKTFTAGGFSGTLSTQDFSLPSNAEGARGFFFDVVRDNQKLKAFMDAVESRSDINVLATPKLLALDGKEAEIIIGGQLGYYLITTTETSTLQSVEFLNIGTQLKLKPHISQGGKIVMEIHPEVSDGSLDALGLPSTSTTEVTTSLLAEDGDTIFIGGLIREGKEKIKSNIPFLGRIPLLGTFFGKTIDRAAKSEIVILITPYIVSPENQPIHAAQAATVSRAEKVLHEKENTAEKLFITKKMYEKVRRYDSLDSLSGKHSRTPAEKMPQVPAEVKAVEDAPEQVAAPEPEETVEKAAVSGPADVPSSQEEIKTEIMPVQESLPLPAEAYTLLVGTFYTPENAEALHRTLQSKGYPAYVLHGQDKQGKPVSAVKLGPMDNYDSAQQYAGRLQEEESITAVILTENSL
jgi:type IV pilus assembly protein PilQ